MAIITKIDGGKQAITFNNDNEPVAVYVDGQLQKDISFVPKSATGTTSVTYESEYKKNLLELDIEGNTYQKQLQGYNLFDIDTVFPTMYYDNTKCWTKQADGSWYCFNIGMLHHKVLYTNTERRQGELTFLVNQKTNKDDTSITAISYVIHYTDGSKDLLTPTVSTTYADYSITSNAQKTVDYIRFSYSKNSHLYIKHLMINWGEPVPYEEYTGGEPVPNTNNPQPIQNAENLSVELSGTNLFDTKAFVDNAQANGMSSTRIYEIESGIYIHQTSYQEDATKFNFGFKNGTQYTVSFDAETILQYTEGAGSCGAYFYYDDDTRNAIDIHLNSVGFKQRLTLTSTFGKNVIGFAIGVWNYRGAFNLTNVMLVENSTEQPYQPYFEPKTVQIPSEVTLASQDKLLVNYIDKSVKVNREYVKLNLADLTWNYGISSQTNVTFFNCYLPYTFTGTGYFNRGTLTNIPNAELNEMTNTIVIRTSKVGTQGQLEIAFSPDFDLKADGNNYGDVNKLMAWLEANPCEVLLKISSDLEETYTGETWASDLLALPTQNATNIITVTSDLPASKVNVKYAKWGGRDENLS